MIIILSELLIGSLIILFLATQIIIPFMRGTEFLPIFTREAKLQKKLEEARQESVEVDMINEIKTIKTDIKERVLQTDLKGAKKDNTGADVTNQIRSVQADTDKKLEEGPVIRKSNRRRA
jgi:hypothetical protein